MDSVDRLDRRHAIRLGLSVVVASATVASMLTVATRSSDAQATEASTVITADQARQHVGKRVTVQFKVQHTKAATSPDRVYLDSQKDYRDSRNLGVLIEAAALPAFQKGGIEKPAAHYEGKTIRITGMVFVRDDNVFIKAAGPSEIENVTLKKT